MKKGIKQLVEEANSQIKTLSVDEARALYGKEGVTFVDIRDVRELERDGQVPGALHAPRGMLEFWVDPDSPYHKDVFSSGKRLVFFCASGWRSALAAKTVKDMGLDNVAHIKGGFTAWKAAGLPVEAKSPPAKDGGGAQAPRRSRLRRRGSVDPVHDERFGAIGPEDALAAAARKSRGLAADVQRSVAWPELRLELHGHGVEEAGRPAGERPQVAGQRRAVADPEQRHVADARGRAAVDARHDADHELRPGLAPGIFVH